MINEKEKRLALLNGETESLRKQNIIKEIREKYDTNDELAILRKMVFVLANAIKKQHPNIDFLELYSYNDYVERIKNKEKFEK